MIPYFSRNWVAPPKQNSTRTGAVLFCGDARKYDFHILVLERIFLSKHGGINSEPFERNSAGECHLRRFNRPLVRSPSSTMIALFH